MFFSTTDKKALTNISAADIFYLRYIVTRYITRGYIVCKQSYKAFEFEIFRGGIEWQL